MSIRPGELNSVSMKEMVQEVEQFDTTAQDAAGAVQKNELCKGCDNNTNIQTESKAT